MLSYSTPYVEAERQAMGHLPPLAFIVLRYLFTRSNEIGVCWPGIRLIAQETRLSKDTVQAALETLAATGCIAYVRRNGRDPVTGQKLCNVYQLNPELLYIRPELREQAQQSWERAGGQALSYSEQDRTNNRTNPNATNSSPNGQNQQQQPLLPETHSPSSEQAVVAADIGAAKAEVPLEIGHPPQPVTDRPGTFPFYPHQRPGSQEKLRTAPTSGVNRLKPNYEELQPLTSVLPDESLEGLAQQVRDETHIPIKLARGLVSQYGWQTVKVALQHPGLARALNPGGFLRWLVQGDHIDPQTNTVDPLAGLSNGKQYIQGALSDFIQH